jgi:hypothetical protein
MQNLPDTFSSRAAIDTGFTNWFLVDHKMIILMVCIQTSLKWRIPQRIYPNELEIKDNTDDTSLLHA